MARLKIEIAVPDSHVEQVIEALHAASAGRVGQYERCASISGVTGTWLPLPGSQPFDGEIGVVQHGQERKVESVCDMEQAAAVRQAVRAAHPYEEPVICFVPLYEPEDT